MVSVQCFQSCGCLHAGMMRRLVFSSASEWEGAGQPIHFPGPPGFLIDSNEGGLDVTSLTDCACEDKAPDISRAAKRGGFKWGGFPIWTCPSFFVLFCPFWDFPDFSGIFPICSGMVRGLSRFVLFLFLGLLRAHTRNSPERVRDTIWTFPEKSGKHPGLETPRFSFSQTLLGLGTARNSIAYPQKVCMKCGRSGQLFVRTSVFFACSFFGEICRGLGLEIITDKCPEFSAQTFARFFKEFPPGECLTPP